jgi:hypothetical protein
MVDPLDCGPECPSMVKVRIPFGWIIRCSPYKSRGSSESRRPFCIANSVAVDRVEAPIFT